MAWPHSRADTDRTHWPILSTPCYFIRRCISKTAHKYRYSYIGLHVTALSLYACCLTRIIYLREITATILKLFTCVRVIFVWFGQRHMLPKRTKKFRNKFKECSAVHLRSFSINRLLQSATSTRTTCRHFVALLLAWLCISPTFERIGLQKIGGWSLLP